MLALLRLLVLALALCLAAAAPASAGTDTATAAAGGGSSSSLPRPALELSLALPEGISVAPDGSYLIADKGNNRIVRVRTDGVAVLAAGGGTDATSNGIPATSANVHWPTDVAATPDGGFLYVENRRNRVRKVDANGIVRTVAGGKDTSEGDGGPATAAGLYYPWSVAVMPDGGFVVSQPYSYRVRRVMPDGTIRTILGDGFQHYPDNVPGTQSGTKWPYGLAVQKDGSVLVAEDYGARIRRVRPDGIVVAFAGSGTDMVDGISQGSQDGKPATEVGLGRLCDIAVAPDDSVVVAQGDCAEEPYVARDRYYLLGRITPDGKYRVFAGSGYGANYQVEGRHRRDIPLGRVRGLAFTAGGDLLHTENSYWRAWRIDTDLLPPDTTKPQLAVTSPTANARFGGTQQSIVAAATASDASGIASVRFHYRWPGGGTGAGATDTTAPYQADFTARGLPTGPASVEITATDNAGNTSSSTVPITLDNTAPALAATGGVAEGAWHGQGPVTLRFAAAGATVLECGAGQPRYDPNLAACSAFDRHTFTPSRDGEWVMKVRAADDVGNETTLTRSFRVDATAPVVVVHSNAPRWIPLGTPATISGDVDEENLASWECRGPGESWHDCDAAQKTDDNDTEGEHVWQFRATDVAGNVTTGTRSWIVDGSRPTVAIAGGPAEGAHAGEIRFDVDARDAHSGLKQVRCSWDGGPYGECGPMTLGPGAHSFRVRAEDNLGLTAEASRSFRLAEEEVERPAEPGPEGPGTPEPGPEGPGTPEPADRTAPTVTLTAPQSVRAAALVKGLKLTIGCSESCRGTATLTGPGGLKRVVTITAAGPLRLKVTQAAVRRGLRASRPRLKLTVRVADDAGNAATRTVSIVLRR